MAVQSKRRGRGLPDYRVTVVQHGGFAGVPITFEADTAALPARRAATLRRLIEASGLLDGAPDVAGRLAPEGRDLAEWTITVHRRGGDVSVRCTEDAAGEALCRLAAFVRG